MESILNFIKNNYEWLFSGAGLAIILLIIKLFRKRKITNSYSINSPAVKFNKNDADKIQYIHNQTNYNESNKSKGVDNTEAKESLKEIYRFIDKAIKSTSIALFPQFGGQSDKDYLKIAKEDMTTLLDYYDKNDFFYPTEINDLIKTINEFLISCLKKKQLVEELKVMGISENVYYKEYDLLNELYDKLVKSEIPNLKKTLSDKINEFFK